MQTSLLGLRFILIVLLLATAPKVASAYIDPGNGAYMVQALFAMIGAALFYLRHPGRTLKAIWGWVLRRGRPGSQDSLGSEHRGEMSPAASAESETAVGTSRVERKG
jgi:hypothetical protein